MKVQTQSLENCQVVFTIEAEGSELDKSLDEAYHRLVNQVSVPGFRKGKAPRAVLVQHIGKKSLLEEALEHLVPQLYKQAIESQKINPIAGPEIEIIQTEPLVFKATVQVKPEVRLGDYYSLKLEPKLETDIGEEEISVALEGIRERYGAWVPVDRAVELGDLITMDIQASVDGKPWLNHKGILYEVNKDSPSPVPGFALNLLGAEKNKEKNFSLTIPDDYPIKEMRGKESTFKVTVTEIKNKQLPELGDELARSAGYANLENMKKKVTDDLRAKAEARNRLELRQKVVEALVQISEINYPPILEDEEVAELARKEARHLGFRELADYLKRTGKTEEELKQQLRPIAKKRLIERLVLEKLAEEEKIEISSSEVDNKINESINSVDDKEKARQFFSLPQVRQSIKQSLLIEKAVQRLLEIAMGNFEHMTKGGR